MTAYHDSLMSSMGLPKPIHTIHFHLLPQLHVVPHLEGLGGRELTLARCLFEIHITGGRALQHSLQHWTIGR